MADIRAQATPAIWPRQVLIILAALAAVSIVAFIRLAWDQDRIAAWLFVPYLAWVSYATLLNVSIWWLN